MSAKCLLVRNKPYGKVDMFDFAYKHKCAFLGYPAISKAVRQKASTLAGLVTPFNATETEWDTYKRDNPSSSPKTQEHRNKYLDLLPGESLLLMPRLSEGRVYIGTYTHFTFHNKPAWQEMFWKRYEDADIKKKDRDPKLTAVASVCQTLHVDEWKPVPFVNIPAWIRAQCFGLSGAAWIHPIDERSVTDVLNQARLGVPILSPHETNDITEVANRLLEIITPEPFEHLMVALLQLENPEQTWLQVGGSGDGGVDGIGYNPDGRVAGLLQCKWQYDGTPVEAEQSSESPLHLAYLVEPKTARAEADNITFYDRNRIAALVVKHADNLPMAITLKVKCG